MEKGQEAPLPAEKAPSQPPAERVYQGEYIDRKSRLAYREIVRERPLAPNITATAPAPSRYHASRAVDTYQSLSSEAAKLDEVELLPRIDNFV